MTVKTSVSIAARIDYIQQPMGGIPRKDYISGAKPVRWEYAPWQNRLQRYTYPQDVTRAFSASVQEIHDRTPIRNEEGYLRDNFPSAQQQGWQALEAALLDSNEPAATEILQYFQQARNGNGEITAAFYNVPPGDTLQTLGRCLPNTYFMPDVDHVPEYYTLATAEAIGQRLYSIPGKYGNDPFHYITPARGHPVVAESYSKALEPLHTEGHYLDEPIDESMPVDGVTPLFAPAHAQFIYAYYGKNIATDLLFHDIVINRLPDDIHEGLATNQYAFPVGPSLQRSGRQDGRGPILEYNDNNELIRVRHHARPGQVRPLTGEAEHCFRYWLQATSPTYYPELYHTASACFDELPGQIIIGNETEVAHTREPFEVITTDAIQRTLMRAYGR